ncbi:MAG: helix-hairpin-helix domain-containing protein [Proteobacteria bacterium]|nr:helix-hairpin-helix domain-containing protein [Pseudomonadota bacterium]
MPEITIVHIVILVASLAAGIIVGWIFRGRKSTGEKTAINLGWQEQLAAQRNEHERLLEQNKSLMKQNGQYQASNKDSKMRASELSAALKEAFERRDELQRQIKDIRSNLEATVAQRNQLQNDMQNRAVEEDVTSPALKVRDERIAKLKKDLDGWQQRVPPLVERFRVRNEEANAMQSELLAAQDRIAALESMLGSDETRVEPVDADALGDDLNASNDPDESVEDSVSNDVADLLQELEQLEDDVAASARVSIVHDDLMQIKGIGPAIAKTLHELGIFQFEQIAGMSEYDIDRVAERLKGFRSRIYREDWIGQARILPDQKQSGSA